MSDTSRLLKAMDRGMVIVCRNAPHKNREVTYSPRHIRDSRPWVVGKTRYPGAECKAMHWVDLQSWADAEDEDR